MKESPLEESTIQCSDDRSSNQQRSTKRIKRQPTTKKEITKKTIFQHKYSTVDFCSKPRYCNVQYKSRKPFGKYKKTEIVTFGVNPSSSCKDLARMGYSLKGFYPLKHKEEKSEKIKFNHCAFNLKFIPGIKNEGINNCFRY